MQRAICHALVNRLLVWNTLMHPARIRFGQMAGHLWPGLQLTHEINPHSPQAGLARERRGSRQCAASVAAQRVKPPPLTPASHSRVLVRVPAALLLLQLSASGPRKTAIDRPSAWAPAAHLGALDGAPGSWRQPDPALAVAVFWGMEQMGRALWVEASSCPAVQPRWC